MISLSARTKSVALAFAMITSVGSASCVSFSNPFAGMGSSFVMDKKTLITCAVLVGVAGKVRLDTKPRGTYSYDNWQDDIIELLNSYNIFDTESRATIRQFIDKYFVGSKFKKDEYTIRTKEEDGSVVAAKRNKVTQKPSGLMGLIDAYVLQQLEPNTKLITPAVVMCLLLNDPISVFVREMNKYYDIKPVINNSVK